MAGIQNLGVNFDLCLESLIKKQLFLLKHRNEKRQPVS